jgi:hypothetical protein
MLHSYAKHVVFHTNRSKTQKQFFQVQLESLVKWPLKCTKLYQNCLQKRGTGLSYRASMKSVSYLYSCPGTCWRTGGHGESNKLFYNFSSFPSLKGKRRLVTSTDCACQAHIQRSNQLTDTMKWMLCYHKPPQARTCPFPATGNKIW